MNVIQNKKKKLIFHKKDIVKKLKFLAKKNKRKRSRICFHNDNKNKTNEMIIALMKRSYIPPHIHPDGKSESYHVIEGKMNVYIFSKKGILKKIVKMGDYRSGLNFYYRMNKGFYHMPVSVTKFCVYHETYSGPFIKTNDVKFPKWAPKENEIINIKKFMSRLY